ncbi:CoA-binding protein [Streptoalloteichus tenebrarius]|nr:CoA-binding protein [Streptoalloteichus tenebrarius]
MQPDEHRPRSWQDPDVVERVIRSMRSVAVVGVSPRPDRPSHQVARYLHEQGIEVVAVNPNLDELFGRPAYPSLLALPRPVDVVDVFRRQEAVPPIAEQAVALGAGALWLQLGVVSEEGARIAADGGLDVVVDLCLKVEHALRR